VNLSIEIVVAKFVITQVLLRSSQINVFCTRFDFLKVCFDNYLVPLLSTRTQTFHWVKDILL